jgi:hypothetical protein
MFSSTGRYLRTTAASLSGRLYARGRKPSGDGLNSISENQGFRKLLVSLENLRTQSGGGSENLERTLWCEKGRDRSRK